MKAGLHAGTCWGLAIVIALLPALLLSAAGITSQTGVYERGFVSTSSASPPDFRPLPGAIARFGTSGGATYRIEMPERWNGDVVLFARGFHGVDEEASVSNPPRPIRQQFIGAGFAWATSSYSQGGFSPSAAAVDMLALKRLFVQEFGTPRRTLLFGQSMGGGVVALSLEQFPNEFDGGLSLCGAVGGQEEIDDLLSWPLIAEFVVLGPTPTDAVGVDVGRLREEVLPALGDPSAPTDAGAQFASVVRELTGGSRPFFLEGFRQQYRENFEFVLIDPNRETLAARAATNTAVRYRIAPGLGLTSEAINAGIRRLAADPEARAIAPISTGQITKPLLTLHGTGDLLVPIVQEVRYREKVTAAGASALLVQRAVRSGGHCQFTDAEVTSAWIDLLRWVREGVVPPGDDLSGSLVDVGRAFTKPLRPGDPGTE